MYFSTKKLSLIHTCATKKLSDVFFAQSSKYRFFTCETTSKTLLKQVLLPGNLRKSVKTLRFVTISLIKVLKLIRRDAPPKILSF